MTRIHFASVALAAAVVMACVSVSPSPSPSIPSPTAVATTQPTATPEPTPSLSPTPTPAPPTPSANLDGDAVIELFRSEFALAKPPFHLEGAVYASGTVGGEYGELNVSMAIDVSGENFDGEMEIEGDTIYIRLVDGKAYAHEGDGSWQRVRNFAQTQPLNPFGMLDSDDLTYVGMATLEGKQLHHLQTTKWIGDELEVEGWTDVVLVSNVFDIYVDDGGIPDQARLVFELNAMTISGRAVDLTYDVQYIFSKVGEPVTIEAPV